MFKETTYRIIKSLVIFGMKYLYNYMDSNSDGKLSKKEISNFIKQLKRLIK